MVKSCYSYLNLRLFVLILSMFFLLSVYIVLLGVLDQKVGERTFQANMERRVAMLLGEAMGLVRRVKRATTIGNSSVQVLCLCIALFKTVLSDCIHSCIAFGEDNTYRAKSVKISIYKYSSPYRQTFLLVLK